MSKVNVSKLLQDLPAKHHSLMHSHLTTCMQQFDNLFPKISDFTYDNGQQFRMILLSGTIPMPYKGSVYHIPVNIWLHKDYPYQPPIVLVVPTKDMQIKPSKIVDNNGRIYLPYLHEWRGTSDNDLVILVNVLCMEFSTQPPLYAKPPQPTRPKPTYNTAAPGAGYAGYTPNNNTPPTIGWNLGGNNPADRPHQSNQQGFSKSTLEREDTQAVIRNSMVSKVELDLRNRYMLFFSRYEAEVNAMKQQEQELLAGAEQLQDITTKIDEEKAKIRDTITLFKTKDEELREFLSQHEKATEEDAVDKQIEPKAPLFKQFLNLYAEESALDDAIYYLAEALRSDVINIQVFLKNVRTLSRKKFMVRALMNKVREQAHKCEIR